MGCKIDNTKQDVRTLTLEEAIEMNKQLKQGDNQSTDNTSTQSSPGGELGEGNFNQSELASDLNNADAKLDFHPDSSKGQNGTVQGNLTETSVPKTSGSSKNLMQTCIDCFQNFFHTLVTHKIVQDRELVQKCFDSLLRETSDISTTEGDIAVTGGFYSDTETALSTKEEKRSEDTKISLGYVDEKCLETFTSACQLMVEFASFPMYCTESRHRHPSLKQGLFV